LRVTLATQTFAVFPVFNLLSPSGRGYTRGKASAEADYREGEVTILREVKKNWIKVIAF
jgi:hypothetical protein